MNRNTRRETEQRTMVIEEVNMKTGIILARDNFNTLTSLSIHANPAITSIPAVGEEWIVSRKGVNWFIDKRVDEDTSDLSPGDRRIKTSGKIYLDGESVIINGTPIDEIVGSGGESDIPERVDALEDDVLLINSDEFEIDYTQVIVEEGDIDPTMITPGANNTYLTTNASASVTWKSSTDLDKVVRWQIEGAQPNEIPDLWAWWKGSNITGVADLGNIANWPDASGAGRTLTIGAGNPKYVANARNGHPGVRFTPSDYLQYTAVNVGRPNTIFIVARATGGTNARFFGGRSNNWLMGWYSGTINSFYYNSWIIQQPSSVTDAVYHMITSWQQNENISGTKIGLWGEGFPLVLTVAAQHTVYEAPTGIQVNGSFGTEFSHCEFVEIIIYNQVLTLEQVDLIHRYLRIKYDMPVN